MHRNVIALALLLIAFNLACGPESRERTFQAQGAVCVGVALPQVFGEPAPDLGDGEDALVKVVFTECMSSCAEDIQTSCTLEESADGYIVHSSASFRVPGGDCNDGCNILETECGTITMEDELLFRHGDEEFIFTAGSQASCQAPPLPDHHDDYHEEFEEPPGSFCILEAPQPDEPFNLTFGASCMSSSCAQYYSLHCLIGVDEQEITAFVSGTFSGGIDQTCTDDCGGTVLATCEALLLPEGTYTFHYGDESQEFTIPGEAETCLHF